MNDRTCGGCRFWHRDDPISQHGQCRRYPPSVAMPHGLVRPTMAEDNFCGEWRDISITPGQEQRAELVTRFALAIVSSDEDVTGGRWKPDTVWRMASEYVDARPKIGGES
jgi:hypothetical protein